MSATHPISYPATAACALRDAVPRPTVELCFLGLGLVIALSTSTSLFTSTNGALASIPAPRWLANTVRIAVFLAFALWAGRGRQFATRPRLGWIAGGCAAAGIAGTLAAPLTATAAPAVYTVGTAVMALGYAALYLLWIELYARMDLPHVLMYFSLAHLLSAALSYVLSLISASWFVAAALVSLPLASARLLALSVRRGSSAPFMQGEAPVEGWTFPVQPVVLLASFTFANSFVRHFLAADLRSLPLLGVIAAACLVLALRPLLDRRGIQPLYALSFPLVIAGSFCVLVTLPGFGTAGALLTNAAYTLFSIFATVLLCSISYRYGVNALWLFGYAQAAVSAGSLAASVLSSQVDFVSHDPALLTLTVGIVVVAFACLYAAFGGNRDRAEAWGIVRAASRDRAPAGNLEERCARLARQYGLTRREEEVALLLVDGAPFAQIETELCVSNSTLKTHARHIYAKVGVAGRKELADRAAAEG